MGETPTLGNLNFVYSVERILDSATRRAALLLAVSLEE